MVEVLNAHQISLAVAQAYLGPSTGSWVLEGHITRGDIETIKAAILISDLRGWTRLNSELPPKEVVSLANRYFERVAAAIDTNGGEILKFLGDGVLAIFTGPNETACKDALADAKMAQNTAGGLDFGIGLHLGAVQYGNVGSAERIDFTVLGQAVNIAARVESLCGELQQPVLYSATFANALTGDSTEISQRVLKGLKELMGIFVPA